MPDVFINNGTLTTTSSSGTTNPSSGTSETWSVAALSALWPALLTGQTTQSIQDPALPAEIIRITASSGSGDTSITVTRGADGTTPLIHAAGATFVNTTVASALNAMSSPTIVLVTSTHTTALGERTIVTSGTFTDTLPAPTANGECWVTNQGSGTVTVAAPSGTLHNLSGGTGSMSLTQGVGYHFVSDGTNWYASA